MKKRTPLITLSLLFLVTNNYSSASETVQHNLQVDGMTCPFCTASSSKALQKIEGVQSVDADLETGIIKVCADKSADMNDEKLAELFLDKGFKYRQKETLESCELK